MQEADCSEQQYESCIYSERLLDKLVLLNKQATHKIDIKEVKKSIYYAKKYHGHQKRQSGEPYYSHPIEVAYMVSDYLFRTDIIVTAILHDTIEDTELTFKMIEETFGAVVANQVMDLTRVEVNNCKLSAAEMLESLWLQNKKDTLLIKLFDRLHNMQTIHAKSPEKIKKIVEETLKYFLIFSELMEITTFPDILYDVCYQANLKLGLISKNNLVFDRQFSFDGLLTSENKIY